MSMKPQRQLWSFEMDIPWIIKEYPECTAAWKRAAASQKLTREISKKRQQIRDQVSLLCHAAAAELTAEALTQHQKRHEEMKNSDMPCQVCINRAIDRMALEELLRILVAKTPEELKQE